MGKKLDMPMMLAVFLCEIMPQYFEGRILSCSADEDAFSVEVEQDGFVYRLGLDLVGEALRTEEPENGTCDD